VKLSDLIRVQADPSVPLGEARFVDTDGNVVGRIVNLRVHDEVAAQLVQSEPITPPIAISWERREGATLCLWWIAWLPFGHLNVIELEEAGSFIVQLFETGEILAALSKTVYAQDSDQAKRLALYLAAAFFREYSERILVATLPLEMFERVDEKS